MINFDNSNVFYEPFPHCVIREFLDKNIYDEICKEYPNKDYFEEIKDKSNDNKFKKYRFSNSGQNFKNFLEKSVSTKKLYEYLHTNEFILSLNNFLLNNQIDIRLNQKIKISTYEKFKNFLLRKSKIDFEFSLIPLDNGYILPHTDGANKLVGFVIPILDNNEELNAENLGTKILKAKNNKFKYNYFNKTVPFEETELVREIPFKKNQISLHVKTFNSLHGVGPIIDKSNEKNLFRKSISIFILK